MSQEVLIVGAGPTGLSLAITLRRFGRTVRIVDRATEPSRVSKALAIWSASLEALEGMGVAAQFVAAGRRLKALTIGDGAMRLATLGVGTGIDSPFPYPLMLPQSDTERLLGERLRELGVTVERGVDLVGLVQADDRVTASLRHPDGRIEEASAAYLAGCDGARSAVRAALGITFEGEIEPQMFLLGDVRIDGDLDRGSIYLWWHGGGTIALFPFEDEVWRVFAMRGEVDDATPPTLGELQSHVDRHGPPGLKLRDPTWLSAFRINERVAARYRAGRCFLAGDAAHIHSPAGGQGMNTGIQDAVNLGWKLAHVLGGVGDAGLLLESYEAERRPVARDVVDGAAQKLHLAFGSSRLGRVARDIGVAVFGNLPVVQQKLQVELSETEIVYRDGPLVRLGNPPRRAGRTDVGGRARDAALVDPASGEARSLWPLLSAPRHSLLVFEDAPGTVAVDGAAAIAGPHLQVIRIDGRADPDGAARRRYGLAGAGWVLVRPDQVVAARGGRVDADDLTAYVGRVLRPVAT